MHIEKSKADALFLTEMEEGANLVYIGKQGGISSYLEKSGILSTKNSQNSNFSLYKSKNLGKMPLFVDGRGCKSC